MLSIGEPVPCFLGVAAVVSIVIALNQLQRDHSGCASPTMGSRTMVLGAGQLANSSAWRGLVGTLKRAQRRPHSTPAQSDRRMPSSFTANATTASAAMAGLIVAICAGVLSF